jgi:serine/threonine protein kinase
MAVLYKGIQRNLSREVALKVIHPNLVHDREFLERFHQEAKVAASLNHPNIVKIYDEGEMNGVHFMAMEFLDGLDLHRLIKSKEKLGIAETLNYGFQSARALEYIHSLGLLHRDIKSSNIFITRDNRAVLTDFGIVRANNGPKMTQMGAVFGTPEYMSPEQAQGAELDEMSDLYGLGVVMYECLCGRVPFRGESPLNTINEVINVPPKSLLQFRPDIPQNINNQIIRLLDKKPSNRLQNPRELSTLLQHLLNGTPTKKTESSPSKKRTINKPVRQPKSTPSTPAQKASRSKILKLILLLILSSLGVIILILISVYIFSGKQYPPAETPIIPEVRVSPPNTISIPVVKNEPVVSHDTILPSYPGGTQAIMKVLADNIEIPDQFTNVSGTISVAFVINPDGSVGDARVVSSVNFELDPLVLQALQNLPQRFTPGSIDQKPQRMSCIVSIKLPIKKY